MNTKIDKGNIILCLWIAYTLSLFIFPAIFLALLPIICLGITAKFAAKLFNTIYRYFKRNTYMQYEGIVVDFHVKEGWSDGKRRFYYYPIVEYNNGNQKIRYISPERDTVKQMYEKRIVYELENGQAFTTRELRSARISSGLLFGCFLVVFFGSLEFISAIDWDTIPTFSSVEDFFWNFGQQVIISWTSCKEFIDTHTFIQYKIYNF